MNRTRKKLVSVILACALWISFAAPPAAGAAAAAAGGQAAVTGVTVGVVASVATPPRVLQRMSESVRTIGEHLLLGRSSLEVAQRRDHYERLVRDVFDRVLVGYTVSRVEIEAGPVARIRLHIAPWGETVQEVSIQVDYSGIAAEAVPLVREDMGKLEQEIQAALTGLPVDAVDWAAGVARELIREILRRQLPEFHFSLDVEAGRRTRVRLSLFPTGRLVREVNVILRSTTIPNLLLVHALPAVQAQARSMRGLPVDFVERRRTLFTENIRKTTLADPLIRQFKLKVAPAVRPGEDTDVTVSVDAESYRIRAEVMLNVGKDKENIYGQAHFGRLIGKNDEAFMELKIFPGDVSWHFMPGWGHRFGYDSWAGLRYCLQDREVIAWVSQGLGGRWSLRAERLTRLNRNEVALRYRLHDFLSAEVVVTNGSSWLRLVGHL